MTTKTFTPGKLYRYVGAYPHRGLWDKAWEGPIAYIKKGEAVLCLSDASESTINMGQPVVLLSADGVVGRLHIDPGVWEEVE